MRFSKRLEVLPYIFHLNFEKYTMQKLHQDIIILLLMMSMHLELLV